MLLEDVLGQLRAEAVLLGQRVHAEAARLDQRELGRDEEGVGGQKEDGEEQAEDGIAHDP